MPCPPQLIERSEKKNLSLHYFLDVFVGELSRASREGRLNDALVAYAHPDVLVINEVDDCAYGDDVANVLFHAINDRLLLMRSTIFTINKWLGDWGRVLHDEDLAAAIVDRILERGRLLSLDELSMRTLHVALDDPTAAEAFTKPAGISRTHSISHRHMRDLLFSGYQVRADQSCSGG